MVEPMDTVVERTMVMILIVLCVGIATLATMGVIR